MKHLPILTLASIATLIACGGSSSKPPTYVKPAGTVAVNFSVDDTANKVFADKDLQWKGAMLYDAASQKVTADPTWSGPWAPLYDDGPWTSGGHEPAGATAGDHIFGATVFIAPPASGSQDYEYGLVDASAPYNGGWLWAGSNGKFTVPAGATADIKADGQALKKFGTTDLQLVIDTTNLDPAHAWDTSKVTIKGSGWAWYEQQLLDNGAKGDATAGDKKFTFVLSQYVGTGNPLPHTGLLNAGDQAQFIFVFNGVEYKNASGAATQGITAATKAAGASTFTPTTVQLQTTGDKNTFVTIP
ncbi:MAG: hypothetical protein ABR567_01840 [Myxococcales bacterium]|nr:hypothetical protein [Myxococcales bacterium]